MIPTWTRRSWLGLSGFALLGCKERKSPAGAKSTAASAAPLLKAGPFSVTVPDAWTTSAVVEKVEMQPLYSSEERKSRDSSEDSPPPRGSLKPGYFNRPQHWAIRLPAATPEGIPIDPKSPGDDPTAAQILIHKSDEWDVVFAETTKPDPKSRFQLPRLRSDMEAALTKDDNWHVSPAAMDAGLAFECLKRRLDFDGGHGIRMIVQWVIEPEIMRKGQLHYLFLGMSDDDSCQIIATFPINLPGLPEADETEHLGRSIKRYQELTQNHDAYEKDAKAWLEQHAAEITPSLDTLDEMLKSLVVRHWE